MTNTMPSPQSSSASLLTIPNATPSKRTLSPKATNNSTSNANSKLNKITPYIYMMIREYVHHRDIRHLLNTSKYIFPSEIRKQLIYLNLNPMMSMKYCESEKFRTQIHGKVMNKSKQLSINLENSFSKNKTFYLQARNVHRLKVLEIDHLIEDLSPCAGISELSLGLFTSLTTLQGLANIEKLFLLDCHQLTTIHPQFVLNSPRLYEVHITSCPELVDVSALKNVPILHFQDCVQINTFQFLGNHTRVTIIDCSMLRELSYFSKVKYLTVRNCSRILTANGLQNVYSVTLSKLNNLFDISQLEHNTFVSIDHCPLIADVSPLMNVPHVTFEQCANVSQVNMLCTLTTLSLKSCSKVYDIAWLTNLQEIELYECNNIVSLAALQSVKKVTIYNCTKIHNVSMLGNVEYLSIGYCPLLFNIDGLGKPKQKVVKIRGCQNIRNYQSIQHVPNVFIGYIKHSWKKIGKLSFTDCTIQNLTVESCPRLKVLQWFHQVQSLTVSYCPALLMVHGLETVKEVIFRNCPNLVDLGGLGMNSKVILDNCLKLKDVSTLRNVKDEVRIYNCPKVKDITMLASVKFVEVKLCPNQSINGVSVLKNVFANM